MSENPNSLESEFNSIYQSSMAFYEKAMNGDRTHPFVLFKISQLNLKKSNFKKIKEIDNELEADALRQILVEDIKTFVQEVKEYELKMIAIKKVAAAKKKISPSANHRTNKQNTGYRPRNNNTQGKVPYDKPRYGVSRPSSRQECAVNHSRPASKPVEPVKQEETVRVKKPKSNAKYLKSLNYKKKGKR